MTATINVNLAPCDLPEAHAADLFHGCTSKPVPIPCPIPPSFTAVVRLGECCCTPIVDIVTVRPDHRSDCPARHIRVSCSISGRTWEESDVSAIDDSMIKSDSEDETTWGDAMWTSVRALWALVKALVLGRAMSDLDMEARHVGTFELFTQRDSVFAALADMARHEDATCAARDAVRRARNLPQSRHLAPELRESAIELGDYVASIVEQVGVL